MTGNGIASITKTGTSGLVDTYTIIYTNGNTTTFTVTNGEDGEVTETELNELRQQVEDLENNQLTNTPTPATSHYLTDSASAKNRSIGLTGNTTQESTTGKNKLKVVENSNSITASGVTITNNNDGSFKLNGTPTENLWVEYVYKFGNGTVEQTESSIELDNAQNYIFSLTKISGSYTGNIYSTIQTTQDNTQKTAYIDTPITFGESNGIYRGYFNVRSGSTYNNLVISPMVRLASVTDDTYEPYTGGASPNPEYPQDIKNTGDNVNLLDYTTVEAGGLTTVQLIENGFKVTGQYAGIITITGLKTNTDYFLQYIRQNIVGNYQIVGVFAGTGQSQQIVQMTEPSSFNTGNNTTINIWFYCGSATQGESNFTNIKLEEGTKATPYSPYGCGNVNEKVQNKNLFDENNVTFITGILDDNGNPTGSTSSHYTENFYQVEAETQYAISGTLDMGTNANRIYFYDENKNWLSRTGPQSGGRVFITPANCKYLRIQVPFGITLKTGDVQLEQNSTATSYQAHAEQNLSFPLAQGQKLMEDGTIKDGKVINEWGEYVFTGNETFTRDKELTNSYGFYTPSNTIPNSISGTSISTHFKNSTVNNISNVDEQALTVINNNQIVLRINKTLASTVQELKALLAEWYTNGNPLRIQFHRVTPVEEAFTSEQQTAWEEIKKARTYKNITHISSEDETPANVDIVYVRDLETVINNLSN